MGEGGGFASSLASKSLSSTLEPKIRNLKKYGQEKGVKLLFTFFFFTFVVIEVKSFFVEENLRFFFSYFHTFPSFL